MLRKGRFRQIHILNAYLKCINVKLEASKIFYCMHKSYILVHLHTHGNATKKHIHRYTYPPNVNVKLEIVQNFLVMN
jgi:hypothetical protein